MHVSSVLAHTDMARDVILKGSRLVSRTMRRCDHAYLVIAGPANVLSVLVYVLHSRTLSFPGLHAHACSQVRTD